MTQPILDGAALRALEAAHTNAVPSLMQRAGAAAALSAAALMREDAKDVLVLAGAGNNGGDAYETAVNLRRERHRVTVVALADPGSDDARDAAARWHQDGGEVIRVTPEALRAIPERRWSVVVDGLFGIGLSSAPRAEAAGLIEAINRLRAPVLALDLPSGLDGDSGRAAGAAIRANRTISFIAHKPGLFMLDGPDLAGTLELASLGLESDPAFDHAGRVLGPALFPKALRRRFASFHKGDAGSLGILGGASGMVGAALLAGRAAQFLGAGRVFLGALAQDGPAFDPIAPELMLRHAEDVLGLELDAIVVGPGLGRSERAAALLGAAVASEMPCLVDADGLNLLADNEDLRAACQRRTAALLLTPHPGEAGRLLGCSTAEVQRNRTAAARAIARSFKALCVLKGNGSVVIGERDRWYINASGNSGLAGAGTGDVLAGMAGSLLAQGLGAEAALALAVHLHGCAADELASQGDGPVGLTAGELPAAARRIRNRWIAAAG